MSFATFGEIMLRLTPSLGGVKIHSTESFNVGFSGSESNVASSLAWLGNDVDFITKLPNNQLGDAAVSSLKAFGINTHSILRGGDRIGTYFIELGASIRPSNVIYDRKMSAISQIKPDEFDWEKLLQGKDWIFLSGITPVLSSQCTKETLEAAKVARKLGVKVGFDMNYRRSLWSGPHEAKAIFCDILEYTDLLFGNAGVIKDLFDFEGKKESNIENTICSAEFAQKNLGISKVVFTVRDSISATKNRLSAVYLRDEHRYISSTYDVEITDRFGTGDAFAAAFLHAIGRGWVDQESIEFATAAFALKHTVRGDQHKSNEKEIKYTASGKVFGQVLR